MSPQDQPDFGFSGAARWPSSSDADQPPGFEELLISTSMELWLATRSEPHQGRAFLDAGVAALRREQEQTKLKQAVLRHIIGMGMRRLRDEEGVTVKRIVSRTTWDGDPRRPVSRAWVDKHMLTPDQYGKIVDIFSRAEHDYSRIAVDPEAFPAARTGARRNSGYLRQLMRWIGARATGAAVLVIALFLVTQTATDVETVTGLSATGLLMAAASSRLTGAPNIPGFDPAAAVHLGHSVGSLGGATVWGGSVPAATGVASASAGATMGPAATTVSKLTVGVVAGVEALVGVSAPVATTLVAVPAMVAAAPVVEQAATGFHDLLGRGGDPVRPVVTAPSPAGGLGEPLVPDGAPVEVPAVKATSRPSGSPDGQAFAAPTTAAPVAPSASVVPTPTADPSALATPEPTLQSERPPTETPAPAVPSPLAEASSNPPVQPEPSSSTPAAEPSAEPTAVPTPEPVPTPSPTVEPAPTPTPTSTGEPTPDPAPTQEPAPAPTSTGEPTPAPTSTDAPEPSASAPSDTGTPAPLASAPEVSAPRPVAWGKERHSRGQTRPLHRRPVTV